MDGEERNKVKGQDNPKAEVICRATRGGKAHQEPHDQPRLAASEGGSDSKRPAGASGARVAGRPVKGESGAVDFKRGAVRGRQSSEQGAGIQRKPDCRG